jgi:hypothetical protein
LKNTVVTQLRGAKLEQELNQVCEVAAAKKKMLEDELAEEKSKTLEAIAQFSVVNIGEVETLCL